MKFEKAPAWIVTLFDALLAETPGERRIMFGYPAGFVNGNMFTGVFGSFARSIRIEVAQGGGSCSAQMAIGKEVGGSGKTFRSAITGQTTEVLSATAGSLSCSIQQGNVFAQ